MGLENNQYTCPEGQPFKQFRRNCSNPNLGPCGKGVGKYQALRQICQVCLSKMKCCPKADARKITREEHQDARQVACDIHAPAVHVFMHERSENQTIRHLNAAAHRARNALCPPQTHTGARTFAITWTMWCNDEFLLAAAAQNLRKLAKVFPAAQEPRKA